MWEPEVNAQRIDLLDMEYLVANIVRDDQVAHVSVPVCDYAREWRCDPLEGDFLLQNPQVLLKGMLIRRCSILIRRCVVSVQPDTTPSFHNFCHFSFVILAIEALDVACTA